MKLSLVCTDTLHVQVRRLANMAALESVYDTTTAQQVLHRTYAGIACRCRRAPMQVGPFGWNERPASVRKHHDQVQSAALMLGSQNSKRLTLESMVWSSDLDVFRGVVEVGSVCGRRSTIPTLHRFTASKSPTTRAVS
jgi:hypothetical protein